MAPPNTETAVPEIERFDDLKTRARQGPYIVYPDTKYPEIEPFEHNDPGHRADPKKSSIYDNAEKVFDLTPHIGTEVHGIQLSKLTEQQKDDLALLAAERGVVFFRDQDITVNQGIKLGEHYGPLHIHNTFGHPEGLPEIHVVRFDTKTPQQLFNYRGAGDGWHTDVSYEEQPLGLTFLKIDTLPEIGGDTMWSSGYAAYDRLSPAWQKFVEGLEAVHTGQMQVDEALANGHAVRRKKVESVHPLVRTHPVTGWKSLYVQHGFTKRIVGMSKRESDAVLNFLLNHIESGHDFQVRFRWTEDSVAVWDNRITNHNAIFDYLDVGLRHGWRVSPQAEKPFYDPKSKSKRQAENERLASKA
ncbi:hypothetical protein BCR43DRAFT_432262 [Syncephalastrum racemosum]|uniref:TauD/TfdA-like domain-containing protein n=1 Tax=Syncephalastrum racemosum TaxID=13706 RepID=A0A1X2HVA7_SYNRA|nr:hypothetical protein BCR43DRAFT_432262 [Syncephalastrum racemosum]